MVYKVADNKWTLLEQRQADMASLQLLTVTVLVIVIQGTVAQYGHGGGYGGGHGGAYSTVHFSGPVEGHAQPIVAHDKHGKEIIDYVAYPRYKFLYDIADHHTGDFHGQEEIRDGHEVHGQYRLKEPSGGERSVKYVSTHKDGFLAEVHTGKIIHPTGHKYGGYEGHKY